MLAAALLAGAHAAAAGAHASIILIGDSTLVYEQRPTYDVNLENRLTISLKEGAIHGSYYEIADPGSTGIFFPPQCWPLDEAQEDVGCPATGIARIYVRLGTGTAYPSPTKDTVNIEAPTPATVSGGSVTNAGGPRTSEIKVGPVGGNVIYGNPGPSVLNALNGFADTIHSCAGNTVEADPFPLDTVTEDCAAPPESPVPAPETPGPPPKGKPPAGPGAGTPTSTSPSTSPQGQTAAPTQSEALVLSYSQPQSILRSRLLKLRVSVGMPLLVEVHGKIVLPGHEGTIRLAGARVRVARVAVAEPMQLRVPGRAIARLRAALARHRRVYATVQAEAADPASGIEYSLSRRIALVR